MLKINLMYLHGIMKIFSLTISFWWIFYNFMLTYQLLRSLAWFHFFLKTMKWSITAFRIYARYCFFCKLDLSSINWKLQLRLQSLIMIFHQHFTNHYVRLSHQNSSEIKEQFMTSIFLTNTIEILYVIYVTRFLIDVYQTE